MKSNLHVTQAGHPEIDLNPLFRFVSQAVRAPSPGMSIDLAMVSQGHYAGLESKEEGGVAIDGNRINSILVAFDSRRRVEPRLIMRLLLRTHLNFDSKLPRHCAHPLITNYRLLL